MRAVLQAHTAEVHDSLRAGATVTLSIVQPKRTMGPSPCTRAVLGAVLLATAPVGAQTLPPSIVGTWEWTRKSNNCSEQYVFLDNGTARVSSRDARRDHAFRLAWTPEPNGRYQLTMTTVKDHGGADCTGATADDSGRPDTLFVLFSQSRETMILCRSADGPDCIGPLRRVAR